MLSAYQTMIMEATGVMMPDDLAEIEDIMRGENGVLDDLSQEEFAALAQDAKEALDMIRALGA